MLPPKHICNKKSETIQSLLTPLVTMATQAAEIHQVHVCGGQVSLSTCSSTGVDYLHWPFTMCLSLCGYFNICITHFIIILRTTEFVFKGEWQRTFNF